MFAILAFSGRIDLVNINSSKDLIIKGKHKNNNTPILLVHGENDEVVPFSSMKTSENHLKKIGFNVETVPRPDLGHGIDEAQFIIR